MLALRTPCRARRVFLNKLTLHKSLVLSSFEARSSLEERHIQSLGVSFNNNCDKLDFSRFYTFSDEEVDAFVVGPDVR